MKDRNIVHKDDWATPPYFYDEINKEFDFNYDPCPYQNDIKKHDGLNVEWRSEILLIHLIVENLKMRS